MAAKKPLLAPTPRAESSFIEQPTPDEIKEGPSGGDGCIDGCLASPHLKNWFLTLGLWTLIVVQFVCLATLTSVCSCHCYFTWDDSLSQTKFLYHYK